MHETSNLQKCRIKRTRYKENMYSNIQAHTFTAYQVIVTCQMPAIHSNFQILVVDLITYFTCHMEISSLFVGNFQYVSTFEVLCGKFEANYRH